MTRLIKCVVWDIDHTLLDGVFLESGQAPPAFPAVPALLAELAGRGILHAIASKNPPQAAAHAAAVTGCEFVAAECGWDPKPRALARIAAGLGIGTDSLAFVDDDPYERAEVAAALPEVLVLSPEEAAEAAGWPELRPPVITGEARRRAGMYAARRRRAEAEAGFPGSQEEFRRAAGTEVTIAAAEPADVPRLAELAARTRQFNSATSAPGEAELAALIQAGGCGGSSPRGDTAGGCGGSSPRGDTAGGTGVITVRLRDSFGDDGMVGGCVVDQGPAWTVRLLMMSCRAMGRGVIDVLLAWLARAASRAGAGTLVVPCVLNDRNVPLRLALLAAGFRAADAPGGAPRVFQRDLTGPLPGLPDWVTVSRPLDAAAPAVAAPGMAPPAVAAELRRILAAVTGREELRGMPADLPLLGGGAGLDSLRGTLLLREVHRRFGVDVAAEDLNLDALATLGTLADFIAARGSLSVMGLRSE